MKFLGRFDPLRIHGTALPPQLLLAMKLIVLSLMVRGYVTKLPEPWLPMLPFLEEFPWPRAFRLALVGTFAVTGTLLCFNVAVRAMALCAGVVFVLEPMVSRVDFYYGHFFCGAMLVIAGLYHPRFGLLFARGQFAVMYFGSALNKLLDPDWHNGHYFDYWLGNGRFPRYDALDALLPAGWFALFMSWSTIAIEFSLVPLLWFPRTRRFGVWLALLFHCGSMLVAGGDFGIFVSVLLMSFLIYAPWPRNAHLEVDDSLFGRAAAWLAGLDPDGAWQIARGDGLVARGVPGRTYRGVGAFNLVLLTSPVVYLFYLLLITTPRVSYWVGEALASRGFDVFADQRLLELHKSAREIVTVVLLVWCLPPLVRLLGGRLEAGSIHEADRAS